MSRDLRTRLRQAWRAGEHSLWPDVALAAVLSLAAVWLTIHTADVWGGDGDPLPPPADQLPPSAVYNAAWRFFRFYGLLLTPTLAVPPFEHGLQGPATIDGRERGRRVLLAVVHVPVQLHGSAGGDGPGRVHRGRPARRAADRGTPV